MTTIKSTTSGKEVEVFNGGLPGSTVLCINDARGKIMGDILVPRADLLTALRAVDKVDVVAAERAADELQAKLAEAEDDAATARTELLAVKRDLARVEESWPKVKTRLAEAEREVERLSGVLEDSQAARLASEAEHDDLTEGIRAAYSAYRINGDAVALFEALDAALTPPKPFELPTTVPARIVAVKSSTGDEKELTLFTDGDTTWWADIEDWGPFWTRSQVMDQFTGHRLLDGAE